MSHFYGTGFNPGIYIVPGTKQDKKDFHETVKQAGVENTGWVEDSDGKFVLWHYSHLGEQEELCQGDALLVVGDWTQKIPDAQEKRFEVLEGVHRRLQEFLLSADMPYIGTGIRSEPGDSDGSVNDA